MKRPYIITVASEKGGVGKTTIATNLAVYLKAFREDMPVTIASFDNHFSVDQMFSIGPRPIADIAGLIEGIPLDELVNLGQYGVQFIASSRRLQQPAEEPSWLRSRLTSDEMPGILILDTRPILDWFSEAALLAADLVLVPVKDRAALINADALRQILVGADRSDCLWLLPSLVDTRARLNAEVRVHDFLTYAARERDYQVLDFYISKSPKVEGLASGFSSSIRPVLTHARNTAVHGQFKQLAEFVLKNFDIRPRIGVPQCKAESNDRNTDGISLTQRRRVPDCPVCCEKFSAASGHFFFDMSSRRRGYLHVDCFPEIINDLQFGETEESEMTIALVLHGPGLVEPESRLAAYLCNDEGGLMECGDVDLAEAKSLKNCLEMMAGRSQDNIYREIILVNGDSTPVTAVQKGCPDKLFTQKRRNIVRELHRAGLL